MPLKPEPVVSVVVPAFNAGAVLADALASARQQTFREIEVIVVDDGSTDDTADVARRFEREDARFALVSQRNGGVSAARNAGMGHARGEWVAFLDADDEWFPEKLARQLEEARRCPRADFLFSNYVERRDGVDVGLRYRSSRKLPRGSCLPRLLFADLFGTSTVVVRRDLLDRAGSFDPSLAAGEDWDLWLRMAESGWSPLGVEEPLVRYRLWSGNATRETLRMAEAALRVLETRGARCTVPELATPYRQAAALARGNLELARARRELREDAAALAPAAWRAWRHYPRRAKWLLWCLAALWPPLLGGRATREAVRRRIEAKW